MATGEWHRRLDARLDAYGAFDTLPGYAAYLQTMLRLHIAHAWLYDTRDPILAGLLPPSPHAAIEADLVALGTPLPVPPGNDIPPAGFDDARAWGSAYVLLGANLGSREILARMARSGLETGATCFLRQCRAHASYWRPFIDALNAGSWSDGELAMITRSAELTFAAAIAIHTDCLQREPA